MNKIFTVLICGFLSLLAINACDDGVTDPPGTWKPDSLGNDNPNSPWILTGPVNYVNDILIAQHSGDVEDDTMYATATLKQAKDFGEDVQMVTFTWLQQQSGGASISFFAGEDTTRFQELTIEEVSAGVMRARMQFFLGFDNPLLSKFIFKLPPGSELRVREYRSTAS